MCLYFAGANLTGDADVVTPESIQPTVDDDQYWPEEAVLLNAAQNVEEVLTFYEQEDEEQERLLLAAAMGVETEPAQPIPRQAKKAPLVKCKFCGTGFYSVDGYVKHKMGHATNGEFVSVFSCIEFELHVCKVKLCFQTLSQEHHHLIKLLKLHLRLLKRLLS